MKTVEDIKSYLIEKNGAKVAHKKLELKFNGKELPAGYTFKVDHGEKCDCDNHVTTNTIMSATAKINNYYVSDVFNF